MGAWGAGSFQNDWALDWLGDLRESGDASQIQATLNRVVEHGGTKHSPPSILERLRGRRRHTDWLKASVSSKALAAAEIVAVWLGRPLAKLPEGITEWVQKNSSSLKPDIVPLARQAVNIVRTNSELKDLWEEGDATEWHQVIQDLDKRLQN
jgi:hypothetical protein